jgi:APA family basic amino acid/polyamine antiporter
MRPVEKQAWPWRGRNRLARRLDTGDAVVIGLGSMIGAGVFAALGPAAAAGAVGLLIGLGIAGVVAFLNATSSAELAAVYPASGGTYVYGRERLGPFWGYLAGWGFVVGKLASLTAMALTFAFYAAPAVGRPLAAGAVVALTAVNYRGVEKTVGLTRVLVAAVLTALAVVVVASLFGGEASGERLAVEWEQTSVLAVLEAAGLLFFAFAGYARIATLGEEVRRPERTIPRAIPLALGITLLVYAAVALSVLLAIGAAGMVGSNAPLADAVRAGDFSSLAPVVRLGAALAALSVLLSLLAGVSRTAFAMAEEGDLPRFFAAVHPRFKVPHRAELAVGAIVAVTAVSVDLRSAIGFSSFAVLLYYAITNMAAFTLPHAQRRWPRALAASGVVGCVLLAFTLPLASVLAGAAVFALGAVLYALRRVRVDPSGS